MAGERVLILEDDPLLQSVLADRLRHEGLEVQTASTLGEARRALDLAEPDVMLSDLRLPDGESLPLLREMIPRLSTVFVVMTAHATVASAVEALKLGAKDYLEKPFSLDRAVATVRQALEMTALRREVAALRDRSSHAGTTVIGESAPMKRVFELVERLAAVDATTVLIDGESGTGKGAIAQALHRLSRRASGPFLNVTCSALPETLMESELFGHEKGAFTDAHTAKRGLVEMADGGTLFLDEIGDVTPKMQIDLLRVLETHRFARLGGNQEIASDFRLVCATHKNLEKLVEEGQFREDLFYRINVFNIQVPPLRERPEDILPLTQLFIEKYAHAMGKPVKAVAPEAEAVLLGYRWPGNVRELENAVERAMVVGRGAALEARDLPVSAVDGAADEPLARSLAALEKDHVARVLRDCGGNVTQAAKVLGIDRATLYNKLKRYGLRR